MQPILFDDAYWSQRYQAHTDAWDMGMPSPPLTQYIDQLTNKNLRLLIPGCGNAYEAIYLLQQGFTNITLIDISHYLVHQLQQNRLLQQARILHQNFFDHTETYDLILEQTFFCALHPSLRSDYAQHMQKLLSPTGRIAGVLFNCSFVSSPPFGGNEAEYRQLFQPHFFIKCMAACYNSVTARKERELFFILTPK